MRKRTLFILLSIVITLTITGCNNFAIGNISDIAIKNQDKVSLSLKDKTLKNTGVTLVLKNNNNKLLYYDEKYELEIKQSNNWYKINIEAYFNEPLWQIKPNTEQEIKLNWANVYGKLAKGTYRLIKKVYFANEQDQSFYIAVEFTLK